MNSASTVNMVNQITEEKTPVAYMPFVFGNHIFVMAQQNTRRTEDIASFDFGELIGNGQVLQIDPSLHSGLFNMFLSQVEQQRINEQVNWNKTYWQQPCEKMDTSPLNFTCTRSTSSTELSSQNVNESSLHRDIGKYFILDLRKPDTDMSEDLHISIRQSGSNCSKLNARQRLKLRKMMNDDFLA